MASIASLGIHRPSALPFLVAEGVLPAEPPSQLYDWQVIPNDALDSEKGVEELFTTEHCVVWSRGGTVERFFRFDIEKESVKYALFTRFPSQDKPKRSELGLRFEADEQYVTRRSGRLSGSFQEQQGGQSNIVNSLHLQRNSEDFKKQTVALNSQQVKQKQALLHRALVVVLKTQACVFFLSGTSHVVHLPFEVDGVYALPNGLLLQRQVPESLAPSTPVLPSVPQNSFAFERVSSQEAVGNSRTRSSLSNMEGAADTKVPFAPMLNNLLRQTSTNTADAKLPRLYCLTDPLAELGVVETQENEQSIGRARRRYAPEFPALEAIEPAESLIYMSQSEDLDVQHPKGNYLSPILLAVTQHRESRQYSIWLVKYVDKQGPASDSYRQKSKTSTRNTRRRSSYGVSTGTGANTPIARGTTMGRESFGVTKSRSSAVKDLLSEDSFNDAEDDLVSHLDSAMENPGVPTKSSRRVGSLLARADLTSSQDKSTFSDIAGGYPASVTVRKGLNLGSQRLRASSSGATNSQSLRAQHNAEIRKSVEPPTVIESFKGGPTNDLDQGGSSDNAKDSSLLRQFLGLRKEMSMTRIQSINPAAVESSYVTDLHGSSSRPAVFILKPPGYAFRPGVTEADAYLYIADRSTASLLIVSLKQTSKAPVRLSTESNITITLPRELSWSSELRVSSVTHRTGVIDACKIGDQACHRLLIISRSAGGLDQLSLEDPWGSPIVIHWPPRLFLYNPYRVVNLVSPKQRREGGFKRILSQGPRPLISVSNGGTKGTVDLVDAEFSNHRVEIVLQPHDPFVRTMIRLCDSVLPSSDNLGEHFLSAWWNATAWLATKTDVEGDPDWTAFVVVIFAIAAVFVEDRRAEPMTRPKKRKGGLLRSSSGANTNMESWEAMLIEESSNPGTVPAWMQGEAWAWTSKQMKAALGGASRRPRSSRPFFTSTLPPRKSSPYLLHCMSLAREFRDVSIGPKATTGFSAFKTLFEDNGSQRVALATLLIGLHLIREEYKLCSLNTKAVHDLTPVLAQLGSWLEWPSWSSQPSTYYMSESVDMEYWLFDESPGKPSSPADPAEPFQPPSIMHFIEAAKSQPPTTPFISLLDVVGYPLTNDHNLPRSESWAQYLIRLTPRTTAVNSLLASGPEKSMEIRVVEMISWGWTLPILETLPEGIAAIYRSALAYCQAKPSAKSDKATLEIIGGDDTKMQSTEFHATYAQASSAAAYPNEIIRDTHSICRSTFDMESIGAFDGNAEADRHLISRMIFKDDQRLLEAAKLLHPLHPPVAKCIPEPEWSDTEMLEAQQELAKIIAMRTLSVSSGRSCLFFSARLPLLTEKFPIHGFTLSCVMKPSNTTVTADKVAYTEEKVSWAFFHAGVEAGLSIAKGAKGIGTSWILFNKPQELRNRHAGFLFALGLNGHLKSIAKWVAFKYLTPKHTMTSIGLLLGLAASYLGTMDTLITRLLSVHVTRMLPPGAAELNLSPLTQTSGIMGIGLLYCGTQHRRMSEIMLSEMENVDQDDSSSPQDNLRDEGYRLAAGFALGYINLGCGKDLGGLHDMRIVERLLALAIGTKKVSIVHILDKATAAATVAIALIFMKTHNEVLARKIDIPDTIHQFEYVRPDIFLLRTVARHLIMWDDIHATLAWIKTQLPLVYQYKAKLTTIRVLNSDEMPFFNIVAGLCLVIGLRFAGTGSAEVRNLLCHYLDHFMRICRLPVLNYDGKLTRITTRNCQDVVALAAACVMAGTGDLQVLRRLRSLHGRVDVDVPYGSHLAAHLAIGTLFLGGGTYSFGTSNLAVASLFCAFYPLFPATVLDNKSHLQAFRHFWVLAAEARCIVVYDIDTRRLISLPIIVLLRTGFEMTLTAPCMLPELNTIAKIKIEDPEYWSITLDVSNNPSDCETVRRNQGIWVRRRAVFDTQLSLFSTTMHALDATQSADTLSKHIFEWIFRLRTFKSYDRAEQALVLPPDVASAVYRSTRGTVVDDRLSLETGCMTSGQSERLWNLRILFAWSNALSRSGGQWRWLGKEVVERLKARLMMRKLGR